MFKKPLVKFAFTGLLFSLILSFSACSESEPDVVSVTSSIVFDYADSENPPEQRLAVFFQVSSAVQRTEAFDVTHEDSGYSWHVSKPGIFTGMNRSYAYSASLNPPAGGEIPLGLYSVIYTDAAGKEDSLTFTLNYKKELLSAKSGNCREYLTSPSENISIFSDSGELLFMGKAKSSWKSNEDILKDYKLAETKRICYVNPGNSIICMMPEEKLKTEN